MSKSNVIEVVGTLGVIAGLLFVGVEIRQAAVATRAGTVQQVKNAWLDFNLTVASTPELAAAVQRAQLEGWESLEPGEELMVLSFYRSLFHNWSNAYSQYLMGTLDDAQWLPHLRDATALAQDTLGQRIWGDWSFVFDDHFGVLMDSLVAAAR